MPLTVGGCNCTIGAGANIWQAREQAINQKTTNKRATDPVIDIECLLEARPSMGDYYSVIAHVVARLPSKTHEARHEVYERARTALRERLSNYDPALSATALANEQAALETAISRLEAGSLFGDMRRAPREAIAKYILVLLIGSAFLAGLTTLIRTERIYQSAVASQSAITGQPTFTSPPGREKSD
jgi:hypothetical protein